MRSREKTPEWLALAPSEQLRVTAQPCLIPSLQGPAPPAPGSSSLHLPRKLVSSCWSLATSQALLMPMFGKLRPTFPLLLG